MQDVLDFHRDGESRDPIGSVLNELVEKVTVLNAFQVGKSEKMYSLKIERKWNIVVMDEKLEKNIVMNSTLCCRASRPFLRKSQFTFQIHSYF